MSAWNRLNRLPIESGKYIYNPGTGNVLILMAWLNNQSSQQKNDPICGINGSSERLGSCQDIKIY
jgi:hypothetical protein